MLREIVENVSEAKLKYMYIYAGEESLDEVQRAIGKAKLPLQAGAYKIPGGREVYVDSKNPIDYESLTRKLKKMGLKGSFSPAGGNPNGK
jgi:hypothetical protein